ncbi:MAG: Lrp/AsnC family transcriptional regulator [Clostridia bacterium]|nr:Lrp/AsnC family transcriptional regulator [Clostridia bacterium]
MDAIDTRILNILQKNARTPLKAIAEQVFLSSPAVSARIERLEAAGLIRGYSAQISGEALGYQIKAFISMQIEPSQKPDFYPYIESVPNVMECCCVTGDYSMLIKVCFHTTQELDQFINRLDRFGRTRTQIVFSTPVEYRGVPVPEEEI